MNKVGWVEVRNPALSDDSWVCKPSLRTKIDSMLILNESLAEAANGVFDLFSYTSDFTVELKALWSPAPEVLTQQPSAYKTMDDFDDVVLFDLDLPSATSWSIAFTPTFRKSVAGVDKKLQGRVLNAITELSESPITAYGDTVKPLVGERKGLWRYRVGDFRLIYEPRQENRMVVLLEFAARGSIYEG